MERVVSKCLSCIGLLLAVFVTTAAVDVGDTKTEAAVEPYITQMPLEILHVMSPHAHWQWNIDQLNGFK